MKDKVKYLGLVVCLATALASFGCAGTRTHESTGEYIDNSAVTAKVKTALVDDPSVSAMQVKVKTFKGVVQLSGFVDTPQQKQRAEEIARGIDGVREVQNNISVKSEVSQTR